jgi:selenocysteine lyase/cysteine desulfurase
LGPQGTGGLYIAPGMPLHTVREGGTGSSSNSMYQPEERPERYESGTVNMHGIAGLWAGVRHVEANLSDIFAQESALTAHLLEGLRAIRGVTVYGHDDPVRAVGTVSFNVSDLSSEVVADRLDGAGIAVRGGLHCAPGAHQWLGTLRRGAVRASVGYANTDEDIEALIRQIAAIARA